MVYKCSSPPLLSSLTVKKLNSPILTAKTAKKRQNSLEKSPKKKSLNSPPRKVFKESESFDLLENNNNTEVLKFGLATGG